MARDPESLKIEPWAASVAANRTDPDDATLGTDVLDRSVGWPAKFSLATGGTTPRRQVVNQLFCELTSFAVELQQSGIFPWNAAVDYREHAITVAGSKLWRATAATGPTTSNATDPTTSGQTVWVTIEGSRRAPGKVLASSVVQTTVGSTLVLTWAAPLDGGSLITGYHVQWKSGSQVYSSTRQSTAAPTPISGTFTLGSSFTAGANYDLRIRAVNSIGNGAWSDDVRASRTNPIPDQVQNLAATDGVGESLLTWDAPTSPGVTITGYQLQWKSGSQAYDSSRQASATTTSHTVTSLAEGVTYTFRVRARSAAGDGGWSTEATATPTLAKVALSGTTDNGAVNLTWGAVTNAGGFVVQWKSGSQAFGSSRQKTISSGSATATTIGSLTNGTAYDFRARATKAITGGTHSGPWSDSVSVTPAAKVPSQTSASISGGDTQITLSWSAPAANGAAITGFEVQSKLKSASGWGSAVQKSATARAHTFTGLTNGQPYQARVRAQNSVGDGAWSAVREATPAQGVPGRATLAVAVRNQALLTSWSGVSTADRYRIQWKSGSQSYSSSRQHTTGSTARSYEIPNLTNGTQYTVRLAAGNNAGFGQWSSEVTRRPAPSSVTFTSSNSSWTWPWDTPTGQAVIKSGFGGQGGGGGGGAGGGIDCDLDPSTWIDGKTGDPYINGGNPGPGGTGGTGSDGSAGAAGSNSIGVADTTTDGGQPGGSGGGGGGGAVGAETAAPVSRFPSYVERSALGAGGGGGGEGETGAAGAVSSVAYGGSTFASQTGPGGAGGPGGGGGSGGAISYSPSGSDSIRDTVDGNAGSSATGSQGTGAGSGGAGGSSVIQTHSSGTVRRRSGAGGRGSQGSAGSQDTLTHNITGRSYGDAMPVVVGAGGAGGSGGGHGWAANRAAGQNAGNNGTSGTDGASGAKGSVTITPTY